MSLRIPLGGEAGLAKAPLTPSAAGNILPAVGRTDGPATRALAKSSGPLEEKEKKPSLEVAAGEDADTLRNQLTATMERLASEKQVRRCACCWYVLLLVVKFNA